MNGPVLTLLAAIIVALLALGALGAVWRSRARSLIGFGAAGLAGAAALLVLLSLLLDAPPAALTLPLGSPGAPLQLALDPLSACFTLLLFLPASPAMLFIIAEPAEYPACLAPPVCLAGLALALLAGDGVTLAVGLSLSAAALWAAGPTEGQHARAVLLGVTLAAAAASCAAMSAPPDAPLELLLALLGPGMLAGLWPLHQWLVPSHRGTTSLGTALVSGALVPVAIYLLLRLLVDRAATVPLWWSLPPLLLGAISATAGGIAATREPDLRGVLAAGTLRQTGQVAMAVGVALAARAADLPGVVALAFAAIVLLAAVQSLCGTLAMLAVSAMQRAAASGSLDRLGGLVHRMPITAGCLLAALLGFAALPPGAGFAAVWLLLQALLALPRLGGLPMALLLALLVATLGLSTALASAAALRLFGVACLGRPRMPRTEGAREASQLARIAMLSLALLSLLIGIFAGPAILLLADAPLRAIIGSGLEGRASLLGLAPGFASRGYAALPVTFLLAFAGGVIFWLRRRFGQPAAAATGRAWDGGFAPPFARMHFADPTTQSAGAGFTPFPPLPVWPVRYLPRLPRPRLHPPVVVLAAVALWLLLCVWAGVA